jgi:hypothetical protein
MRIVTRPDFDGVVCAVLLYDVEEITAPVQWVEPGDIQKGLVEIESNDIIANLPYDDRCALWFDHHYTNRIDRPFIGAYREAPSAAGIIYAHYPGKYPESRGVLVAAADKIDSADLTMDEVLQPEKYDFVLLAMTISNHENPDVAYWNRLVALLREKTVEAVLADAEVRQNCNRVIQENKVYREQLNRYTRVQEKVAVTDFRSLDKAPVGNRFLVYSLFPEAHVHIRISHDARQPEWIAINVGHSIFNPGCRVNVGLLLSDYEGGGHPGAGACRFHVSKVDEYLPRIIESLIKNEAIETA